MLYETISALCKKRGVSGYKLCKETGISPSLLSDLKNGRTKTISSNNLSKIADYLEVTVDNLLQNDHVNASAAILTPAKQRLLDMIDGLEEEQIDKLLGIISEIKKLCN